MKRILVLSGYSPLESFGHAVMARYEAQARALGHDVRVIRVDQLTFDPVLHKGYREIQPLEPDLEAARDSVLWAEHLVFCFPVWWGGIPAVLKGLLDRLFLPGFAFRYRPGHAFPEQLLKGRTADLLVTMDTPPWYYRWVYRAPAIHQMKKTTLEFCGIRPVRVLMMGPVLGSGAPVRERWLTRVDRMARTL